MWGGGSKMATQAIPPLPRGLNCPQSWRSYAELPSPTTWLRSLKTRGDANGRQVGAKRAPSVRHGAPSGAEGVTWPVWCWVRELHFPAYSSINGCFKKPFSQVRGGKPSPTLLKCQSLPTSSLRAVRSEYPAYIVARLYISRGRGLFGLSQRRFILQATSLQRTVNIKNKADHNSTLGTVSSLLFSRWKVLLHTVYIFSIFNVDWG